MIVPPVAWVIERVYVIWVKVAETLLLLSMISVQGLPCPEQAPVQEIKFQPALGAAVTITSSFQWYGPEGEAVIVPPDAWVMVRV